MGRTPVGIETGGIGIRCVVAIGRDRSPTGAQIVMCCGAIDGLGIIAIDAEVRGDLMAQGEGEEVRGVVGIEAAGR